uniref:Uncharacterized protein n=1 Tax=Leersia perrieri TaxID=77586 RepID=A0A0D9XVB1_9ORYZ
MWHSRSGYRSTVARIVQHSCEQIISLPQHSVMTKTLNLLECSFSTFFHSAIFSLTPIISWEVVEFVISEGADCGLPVPSIVSSGTFWDVVGFVVAVLEGGSACGLGLAVSWSVWSVVVLLE